MRLRRDLGFTPYEIWDKIMRLRREALSGLSRSGFTLMELLIAIMIFSIVGVAIYSSFNVGIRAWRKAEASYEVRQEARYALDTIARGLRSAVNFKTMPFEGTANSVSFARALEISNINGENLQGVFKVTYSLDAQSIYYTLQSYEESSKGEEGTKTILASGFSELEFKYAYLDGSEVIWKDYWSEEEASIPLGVKITITYSSESEGQAVEFSEAVFIPTGIIKEETEGT